MLGIGARPSLRPRQYKSRYFWNCIFFTKIVLPSTRNQWIRSRKLHLFETALLELSKPLSTQIWVAKYEVFKMSGFIDTVRVHTVLKSPWILGEVLEDSLNSIFPWKVQKFLCKPWNVLKFSSTLNVVTLKVFFDALWLSMTEYKS